jgi:SAM-dependent methyltransferase
MSSGSGSGSGFGACPLCGFDRLLPLFTTADNAKQPVEIRICLRCWVLVPAYHRALAVDANAMTAYQAEFHDAQWSAIEETEAKKLRTELGELVRGFAPLLGPPASAGAVLDLGAGRGALVAALRDAGYDGRGCEPSGALAERGRRAFGLSPEHLVAAPAEEWLAELSRADVSIGAVFLWHVIEHVAAPLALVRAIARALRPGRHLFIQAPCLMVEWLYPEHLVLFTEPAVHALARNSGFDVVRVDYDPALTFITFALRRTDAPVEDAWRDPPLLAPGQRVTLEVEALRLRAALREAQEHGRVMVAMADERARGIEGQTKLIDERMKWIEALQRDLGRLTGDLERAHLEAHAARERVGLVEHQLREREQRIAELEAEVQHHARRFVPERVEKAFVRAFRRGGR